MKITAEQFYLLKAPHQYISPNLKIMIQDVNKLLDRKSAYTYIFTSGTYINNLLAFLAIETVIQNMNSLSGINCDELIEGKTVLTYRGQTMTYIGKTVDSPDNFLFQVGKGKSSYESTLPRKIIESKASVARRRTNRKKTDVRNQLGKELGLEQINSNNKNKIAILVSKRYWEKFADTTITIEHKDYFLSELCSCVYINGELKDNDIKHTQRTESPCIYFFSNALALDEYLESKAKVLFTHVYVLCSEGLLKDGNIYDAISIADECEQLSIPYSLFADFSSFLNPDTKELLETAEPVKIWTNLSFVIQTVLITLNLEMKKKIEQLNEWISRLRDAPQFKYLLKLVIEAKYLIFSRSAQMREPTKRIIIKIQDYLKEIDEFDNYQNIIELLKQLNENRYGLNLKKKIEKVLDLNIKQVLIVPDELIEEYKKEYNNNNVFGFSDEINNINYLQCEEAILINPYQIDLRKFIFSGVAKKYIVVVPENIEKSIQKYYLNTAKKIERLLTTYTSKMDGQAYIDSLNQAGKELKDKEVRPIKERNTATNADDSEQWELENDILSDDNNYQKSDSESSTQMADVNLRINLEANQYINATKFYRPYIMNESETLQRISIDNLKVGMFIVTFLSGETIEKLVDSNIYDDSFKDAYKISKEWKTALVDYYRKQHLTLPLLQQKMENVGYYRTIGFYQTWSNPSTQPLVPQDSEFIRAVGVITHQQNIEKKYKEFYKASQTVKKELAKYRDQIVEALIGQPYSELNKYGVKIKKAKVIGIDNISLKNVVRSKTNIFLEMKR